nr:hypothetical protein Itr_chr01CG06680 [Ipomoea trifida]
MGENDPGRLGVNRLERGVKIRTTQMEVVGNTVPLNGSARKRPIMDCQTILVGGPPTSKWHGFRRKPGGPPASKWRGVKALGG